MTLPRIRICLGTLLEPAYQALFLEHKRQERIAEQISYPTAEETRGIMKLCYKKLQPLHNILLADMQKYTGLRFRQTFIDVHIVGYVKNCISSPIIIGANTLDKFIPVLIHELAHLLLSDNLETTSAVAIGQQLFSTEQRDVANHIPVHAIVEKMHTDTLSDVETLEGIKHFDANFQAYKRAWEIVGLLGSDNVLKQVQDFVLQKK